MSVTLQLLIVSGIILASCIWTVLKIRKIKKGKDSGCLGCGLYEACQKKQYDCYSKDNKRHTRSVP